MSDATLLALWLAVLALAVAAAVAARAAGLASTYVRDGLHVGAGIWIVGWPWWDGVAAPIGLVAAVAAAIAWVPSIARRHRWIAGFYRSVTSNDEHFGGLVSYAASYAALTAVGLGVAPFPAAAGLLALSLGDGLGGAAGRRFGRLRYRVGGGKTKTVEGSVVVAIAAALGAVAAAEVLGVALAPFAAVGLGVVAALAEAVAPRGTDNLTVPAAVFGAAHLVT